MNNKGFIISTILFTILIAFLLFLAVTLTIFTSATATVGSGTDDLVNGTKLTIKQVDTSEASPWYKPENNILAVITSKYGELYWPKDFGSEINDDYTISNDTIKGDLIITCSTDGTSYNDCGGLDIFYVSSLMITDTKTGESLSISFGEPRK